MQDPEMAPGPRATGHELSTIAPNLRPEPPVSGERPRVDREQADREQGDRVEQARRLVERSGEPSEASAEVPAESSGQVTREELMSYLDYLEDDNTNNTPTMQERLGRTTGINALRIAFADAKDDPDATPLSIIETRLAQLSRVEPPKDPGSMAGRQYAAQVELVTALRDLVASPHGRDVVRQALGLEEFDLDEPEPRRGGMPDADIEAARERLLQLNVSGGRPAEAGGERQDGPEHPQGLSDAEIAQKIEELVAQDLGGRRPSLDKRQTSESAEAASDIAERVLQYAVTAPQSQRLKHEQDQLAKPAQTDPRALARYNAYGDFSNLSRIRTDDMDRLEAVLHLIGFSGENTRRIVDSARARQQDAPETTVFVNFRRNSDGEIDQHPMVGYASNIRG